MKKKPMCLSIKDSECEHIIQTNSIKWIKGERQYCKIVLAKRNILIAKSLSSIQQSLPDGQFVRIHKSYIVNMNYATVPKGNFLLVDGEPIPIGRDYKNNLK